MRSVTVRRLERIGERQRIQLCDLLIDCVEGGASVSFLWPMTRAKAESFWHAVDAGLARNDRALVAAFDAHENIVGTAQVVWASPENQPHRGDVAKMLVHRRARRMGIGAALLSGTEAAAREAGTTLLVLDTASCDAERLYERGGWMRVGTIPCYALMPDGSPCATVVFYKKLD